MKLYNVAYSGNSYKVRLLLAQLDGFAHDLHAHVTVGARPQN